MATIPKEPVRAPGTRAVRPRDAATLIVYRIRRDTVEVLLGQRHRAHSFLPERYAFPGGRVDRSDSRVRAARPMRPDVEALLVRKTTPARARGLIAAAVRETFEETGLLIGVPDPQPRRSVPAVWRPFFATGLAPAFDRLNYVARAITPHWRPMRFDARFFMVDAAEASGTLGGSGELLDLGFVPVAETRHLDLPLITVRVLELVEDLARNPPAPGRRTAVPRYVYNGVSHDIYME